MVTTKDTLKILGQLSQDDTDLEKLLQVASINTEVAQLIYAARTQAGLTQKDLADLINTQKSVIARLEDGVFCTSPRNGIFQLKLKHLIWDDTVF